jgi:hypothetical protein
LTARPCPACHCASPRQRSLLLPSLSLVRSANQRGSNRASPVTQCGLFLAPRTPHTHSLSSGASFLLLSRHHLSLLTSAAAADSTRVLTTMSTSPPQLALRRLPSAVPPLGNAFGPWGWLACSSLLCCAVLCYFHAQVGWSLKWPPGATSGDGPPSGFVLPHRPSAHVGAPTRRVVVKPTAGAPKIASVIMM